MSYMRDTWQGRGAIAANTRAPRSAPGIHVGALAGPARPTARATRVVARKKGTGGFTTTAQPYQGNLDFPSQNYGTQGQLVSHYGGCTMAQIANGTCTPAGGGSGGYGGAPGGSGGGGGGGGSSGGWTTSTPPLRNWLPPAPPTVVTFPVPVPGGGGDQTVVVAPAPTPTAPDTTVVIPEATPSAWDVITTPSKYPWWVWVILAGGGYMVLKKRKKASP